MPRKHVCPEPEEDNSKAWLDSYADAMTLLLAFFILLFAFSLVDQKKFQEFKAGIHLAAGKAAPTLDGGNGILDLGTGISNLVIAPPVLVTGEKADLPPPPKDPDPTRTSEYREVMVDEAQVLYDELNERIEALGAGEYVQLERTPRGVVVRMDAQVLYRSGSAQILPDGVTILESVKPIIRSIQNPVIVEGHTDSQPTNGGGGFPTNWELSVARAVTVLRYMTEFMDVSPARLSAAGFADTKPRASNATSEGRSQNRRVELVILIDEAEIDVIGESIRDAGDDAPAGDAPIIDIEPELAAAIPLPLSEGSAA